MQKKMKEVLDILNILQESLLSLPEDMLLNIDPRDNTSLEQGTRFIKTFNENLDQFIGSATKIAEQIKIHFSINFEEEDVEKESINKQKKDRIIKELDKTKPYSLDENFTYKRPYGFILGGAVFKGVKTWRNLFVLVLDELKEKDSYRFSLLPEEKKFISNRGNPLFSKDKLNLREGQKLKSGFYVEVNLSANDIRKNIKVLLEHFGVSLDDIKIYLREDRGASMQD